MHKSIIDITGKRFGRLVALSVTEEKDKHRGRKWLCKCDCGKTVIVSGASLRSGISKSCGCLRIETSSLNIKRRQCKNNDVINQKVNYSPINKDKFDDNWMFGESNDIQRLNKMFF